jgi:hypothetical protein
MLRGRVRLEILPRQRRLVARLLTEELLGGAIESASRGGA